MAKEKETKKTESKEREYVIPLRKEWRKVANYRRTGRAVKAIKQFIARHMKVPERDLSKVKLDIYLNQEVWFRGRKKPPAKIKVKVVKEGDIVKVTLAEIPTIWKFEKLKHLKRHSPIQKAAPTEAKTPEKPEEKPEEKTEESGVAEEKKREEKEKSMSVAEQKSKQAKVDAKQQKQRKTKEIPIHRKALKK